MAEVAAEDCGAAPLFEREEQIAGTAAQVEHLGLGVYQNIGDILNRPGSPVAIDLERKQMVQQIVSWSDRAKHGANPAGRFRFSLNARGRGSLAHSSAASTACSTCLSLRFDTISTSPIRLGSTKCTAPWTVFLSLFRRTTSRSAATPS